MISAYSSWVNGLYPLLRWLYYFGLFDLLCFAVFLLIVWNDLKSPPVPFFPCAVKLSSRDLYPVSLFDIGVRYDIVTTSDGKSHYGIITAIDGDTITFDKPDIPK